MSPSGSEAALETRTAGTAFAGDPCATPERTRAMITTELRLPELGLIAGTRGLLGAGVGLLLAARLSDAQRRDIGWTLVAIGVLTTLPLALMVFDRRRLRPT